MQKAYPVGASKKVCIGLVPGSPQWLPCCCRCPRFLRSCSIPELRPRVWSLRIKSGKHVFQSCCFKKCSHMLLFQNIFFKVASKCFLGVDYVKFPGSRRCRWSAMELQAQPTSRIWGWAEHGSSLKIDWWTMMNHMKLWEDLCSSPKILKLQTISRIQSLVGFQNFLHLNSSRLKIVQFWTPFALRQKTVIHNDLVMPKN